MFRSPSVAVLDRERNDHINPGRVRAAVSDRASKRAASQPPNLRAAAQTPSNARPAKGRGQVARTVPFIDG